MISRTRLSITASCPMDLALFPMDRQVCALIFQSSAHPNNEVTLKWKRNSNLQFVQGIDYQDQMMPSLTLRGYRLRNATSLPDQLTGGTYDQIVIDLVFERPLGYYLWEVSTNFLVNLKQIPFHLNFTTIYVFKKHHFSTLTFNKAF